MRKLVAWIALALILSGCSLQQTRVRPSPSEPTRTIIVHQHQALDWSVVSSFYASNQVVLNYRLCPKQHLIGRPVVEATSQGVAITLWANPKTCAAPVTRSITVQLRQNLGHRPLTNPALLQ
ncbi:MAG TPA: hypothetical protein VN108_09615 [Marmoricola sp.]|nr:hypothetical protein [Marmoricola sp.]